MIIIYENTPCVLIKGFKVIDGILDGTICKSHPIIIMVLCKSKYEILWYLHTSFYENKFYRKSMTLYNWNEVKEYLIKRNSIIENLNESDLL